MAITTLSSREFNQDTSRAKKAAEKGPVIITDRGRPAHVLLSIDEYRSLLMQNKSLGELIAMDNADSVQIEPPSIGQEFPTPAELD
jgi:prevent-host-death family protein